MCPPTTLFSAMTFLPKLLQELHGLVLLRVPPHVTLQTVHVGGGEITTAAAARGDRRETWEGGMLLAVILTLGNCDDIQRKRHKTEELFFNFRWDLIFLAGDLIVHKFTLDKVLKSSALNEHPMSLNCWIWNVEDWTTFWHLTCWIVSSTGVFLKNKR